MNVPTVNTLLCREVLSLLLLVGLCGNILYHYFQVVISELIIVILSAFFFPYFTRQTISELPHPLPYLPFQLLELVALQWPLQNSHIGIHGCLLTKYD